MTITRRRRWLLGIPALVVLAAGFWWFRPDALFFDRTVDEDLDPALAAALDTTEPDRTEAPTSPTTTPTADPTEAPTSPTATTTPAGTPTTPPADTATTGPAVLARGEWLSLEHTTTGTVALVDDGGDLQLVLTDLATSNGPDLRVILSPKDGVSEDWFGYETGATYLGPLRGNLGTQVYDVPDDLDVSTIASAVIWCERFSVGFGAANLA